MRRCGAWQPQRHALIPLRGARRCRAACRCFCRSMRFIHRGSQNAARKSAMFSCETRQDGICASREMICGVQRLPKRSKRRAHANARVNRAQRVQTVRANKMCGRCGKTRREKHRFTRFVRTRDVRSPIILHVKPMNDGRVRPRQNILMISHVLFFPPCCRLKTLSTPFFLHRLMAPLIVSDVLRYAMAVVAAPRTRDSAVPTTRQRYFCPLSPSAYFQQFSRAICRAVLFDICPISLFSVCFYHAGHA